VRGGQGAVARRSLGHARLRMMTRTSADYEARLVVRGEEPAFNDEGVDLTQIRDALARTPIERLIWAEQTAIEIENIRRVARTIKDDRRGEH
jgi:isocitrate lyase